MRGLSRTQNDKRRCKRPNKRPNYIRTVYYFCKLVGITDDIIPSPDNTSKVTSRLKSRLGQLVQHGRVVTLIERHLVQHFVFQSTHVS